MPFLSWIEVETRAYWVTNDDFPHLARGVSVDPLGHHAIRNLRHTAPTPEEGGREMTCPVFWEPSLYHERIQPYLRDSGTILCTWGSLIGHCMSGDEVAYVIAHGPEWAQKIVLSALYSASLTGFRKERIHLLLTYGTGRYLKKEAIAQFERMLRE